MNNRDILEAPFAPEQIKQRQGNFGQTLEYIEAHAVIQRLNDAFDGEWSFTVIFHEVLKDTDEVIVLGELKAGNVAKTQFGSSRVTRSKENREVISLGDDLKSAATDALKKTATLLGVALHLSRGDQPEAAEHVRDFRHVTGNGVNGNGSNGYHPRPKNNNGHRSHAGNGSGQGNGNGRLTSNQYKFMLKLNEEKGRDKAQLDRQCLDMFGTVAQHLAKSDASALIQQLLAD